MHPELESGAWASLIASGVEREPGQAQTWRTAAADSSRRTRRRPRRGLRAALAVIVTSSPPSAASIGRSFQPDSAYSVAGSESATMPQPRTARPPCRAAAPSGSDHKLALAGAIEPADRAGVPAAIERLPFTDQRQRAPRGAATDGGRRMQPLDQVEDTVPADLAAHRGEQVLDVAGPSAARAY